MKKIFAFAAVLLSVLTASLSGRAEVVDRIVAYVNNEIITLVELNTAFKPYIKRIEDNVPVGNRERMIAETKRTLLNRMIDTLLIEQEAKKSGIIVTDEDVLSSIRTMLAKKKTTLEAFQKSLASEGTTFDTYKKDVKESMVRSRLLRREVRSKIYVSDEEIGEYYRLHQEDYEGSEAVKLKQILLPFPKNMDGNAKAKLQAEATDILKRLKAGESFDALAAQLARGAAASSSGDLGYVEKGTMLPEVEKVAFSLSRNTISDVIESPVGFHIIQVVDRRGEGNKSIEIIRQEIKAKLEDEKIDKKLDSWLSDLRARSHIVIKL
ncbi:periplasmic chaperone for outer membrane proteins SurA [Syntrophus gentianae]|uniref:Periplasmic chaperone for outer membrane proteins SurA n=1 Tax=Syntrophus gentianae TaxID=43775 RepID=A0A1H7YN88_9BACT|nr:peptidylprolyl isomerase [Syntrophus gentianae]SEM47314.1 periplasmic chaperone for outer membrane proteins SurA [Syntrophus gentianae]